jgi:FixJ family two-component response regulator
LILEDDVKLAKRLANMYTDAGAAPVVAYNVDDALALLRSRTIEGISADIALPGDPEGGLRFLAEVRRRRPFIPVLVLTGHWKRSYARRTARLRGDFVPKPAPFQKLEELVWRARQYPTAFAAFELEVDALARARGLTQCEAQVLRYLALGWGPTQIHAAVDGPFDTLRSRISRVRAKCGQGLLDLVRRVRDAQLGLVGILTPIPFAQRVPRESRVTRRRRE